MYRRYSQMNDQNMSRSQIKRNRIRNILLLLLLAGLITLAVFSIPAMTYRSSERALVIARMNQECREASKRTETLSRTGGSDSEQNLAQIRSNIYAIRTLNEIYSSDEGSLIRGKDIEDLLNSVDGYLRYLTTGMDTGEYQTNLQNSLATLQGILETLE